MAQALVLHDGGRVHLRQPVVTLIGQIDAVGTQLDAAIRILVDVDLAVDQLAVGRRVLEQVDHALVLQGQ
jgi:hypothetical protein